MSRLTKAIRRLRSRKQPTSEPLNSGAQLDAVPGFRRGSEYAATWNGRELPAVVPAPSAPPNPLWEYFQKHHTGPGIWKWEHYFPVYEQFFARFINQPVDVLEIGVYSGGSLDMWANYFGDRCHIHGVDVEPACRAYAKQNVTIHIGDQEQRQFWRQFKQQVPGLDIIIDDGGHTPEQQTVTLEEMLPHLRPGGVYLCEDVFGIHNDFSAFVAGLVGRLNLLAILQGEDGRPLNSSVTPFQQAIYAIHFYPFLVAIERHWTPPSELRSHRHGTQWQPFL